MDVGGRMKIDSEKFSDEQMDLQIFKAYSEAEDKRNFLVESDRDASNCIDEPWVIQVYRHGIEIFEKG